MSSAGAFPTFVAVAITASASLAAALSLRKSNSVNSKVNDAFGAIRSAPHKFMEVKLGPFSSTEEACNYCFDSFTKVGVPPAGPVDETCTCMAYSADGGFNMFCATPTSAAGYVGEQDGCTCVSRDMEHMGKTTCTPIK